MSIFAPQYDALFHKYPALITLFPISEEVDEASPHIFEDTMLRLAKLKHEYTIDVKQINEKNIEYTIKEISPKDAKKLRDYLSVGYYDVGTDRYIVRQDELPESVFNSTINEIKRALKEDRKSLLPYFSFENAMLAFTFGLYQFTTLFNQDQLKDPKVMAIIEELVPLLGIGERDELEAVFKKNAVEIFAITDKLMALAKNMESTNPAQKETLINAYYQIEEMYLAKLKPQLTVEKKIANSIDRHSNFFMGAGRSSATEFPANVQRYTSLAR